MDYEWIAIIVLAIIALFSTWRWFYWKGECKEMRRRTITSVDE